MYSDPCQWRQIRDPIGLCWSNWLLRLEKGNAAYDQIAALNDASPGSTQVQSDNTGATKRNPAWTMDPISAAGIGVSVVSLVLQVFAGCVKGKRPLDGISKAVVFDRSRIQGTNSSRRRSICPSSTTISACDFDLSKPGS
jgi:hypothetical protein